MSLSVAGTASSAASAASASTTGRKKRDSSAAGGSNSGTATTVSSVCVTPNTRSLVRQEIAKLAMSVMHDSVQAAEAKAHTLEAAAWNYALAPAVAFHAESDAATEVLRPVLEPLPLASCITSINVSAWEEGSALADLLQSTDHDLATRCVEREHKQHATDTELAAEVYMQKVWQLWEWLRHPAAWQVDPIQLVAADDAMWMQHNAAAATSAAGAASGASTASATTATTATTTSATASATGTTEAKRGAGVALLACPKPKCRSSNIAWNQVQTRSADEGMTTFCHCLTCGEKWRIY